jgi:phosphatidylglycerol:prolipoprotein diacylglycerol transferase
MLPYFEVHEIGALGLHVRAFGACVTAGIVIGHVVMLRRARAVGLGPPRVVETFAIAVVAAAIAGSFVASAISGGGASLFAHGTTLSSIAALVCAAACGAVFARVKKLPLLRLADAAAYAFPFGWIVARSGCALVHDHLGRASDSWLAVRFPSGARYDLAVAEVLATPLLIVLVLALARRARAPGVIAGATAMGYAALRFAVDLLRDAPPPTPAQWFSIATFALGAALVARRPSRSARA